MMEFTAAFFKTVAGFPPALKFSRETEGKTGKCLSFCGIAAPARNYLSGGLAVSLALSAFAAFALFFFSFSLEETAGAFLLLFAALFSLFLFLPRVLASRREKRMETELPFLLREIAVYLEIGLPFEKCIARAAQGEYEISRELSEAVRAMKSGATMQSALSGLSAKTGSLKIKRSMLLLSSIYETGKGIDALKRNAEELSSLQLSEMRMGSGRFSLLAITFITVSALLPSFFAVFAAASPIILEKGMDDAGIWLAFLVAFPLLDCAALFLMFLFLPPSAGNAAGENEGELLDEYLQKMKLPSQKKFILLLSVLSLFIAAFLFAIGEPVLAALSLAIAPAGYSLAAYAAGKQVEEAETLLPDALYAAASTHKLLSSEKMLQFLANGGFGRISEAFGIALRRQKAGESFPASLDAALHHCPSPLVARAFSLLNVSYETGADMYFSLREAAADVVAFFSLVRERAALLAVQRYTVLASACFLVPVILGTVIFLAPSLSGSSSFSSSSASSPSASSSAQLAATLVITCRIYLAINSALSSLFLALSETKPGRAALYFAFCAPVSEAFFAVFASGALGL